MEYISIGEASVMLGVSVVTMRRWDSKGLLKSFYRTFGNHRRYKMCDVLKLVKNNSNFSNRKVVGYSRVSSHDQKEDLKTQTELITKYISEKSDNYEVIEDLGSGLNYKKKGLQRLVHLICDRMVSTLVIMHKDRLLRFGSDIIIQLCKIFGTEVVIIGDSKDEESFEKTLCNDIISIITVFSAKLYGSRSHSNKKKLKLLNI
jgi:predicted site-specific integrase-resolvase